jgi:AN1-type zinc finger protein 1
LLNHDKQCYEKSCRTLIFTSLTTGVHCPTCNRDYCLKHRMEEDHDCKNVKPVGARPQSALEAQRQHGLAAYKKLRDWAEQRRKDLQKKNEKKTSSSGFSSIFSKNKSSSSSASDSLAELRELKRTAKGEASIPAQNRIYLHVQASADTTKAKFPTGKFFYNKDWSVGKVLDAAAKSLQVENVNNRGGGEVDRLRVFHVEGGRLLKFSEKISEKVETGHMIVLLRGVGDPDLIDL